MKISFYTFGCLINSYETQKLKEIFIKHGDEIAEDTDSDAVIINSCAVTGSAEKHVQQLVSRLKKKNFGRIIAVIGCYGEMLKKKEKTSLPDVDILLDNNKFGIYEKIHEYAHERGQVSESASSPAKTAEPSQAAFSGFVQVQNGCDNRCSFCIVPHLRGNSVSRPPQEISKEFQDMAALGCREIVLAGLNIGLYKKDGYELIDILHMADGIQGIERIRLSSLEPMDVNSNFIKEFNKIEKLVSHLHIPLQSGSDRILKQMNRNYGFDDYLAVITKIREKMPGIAITTDIIVGFPGETEKDFQESLRNIIRCEFSDIHIFKYSIRKGTPAASMLNQITEHQKTSRTALLKGIKWQTKYNYNYSFLGRIEEASMFKPVEQACLEGVTKHNIRVRVLVKNENGLLNGKPNVKITGISEDHEVLTGEILS